MGHELELLREFRPPAAGPDPALARQVRQDLMVGISPRLPRVSPARRRVLPVAIPALAAIAAAVVASILLVGRGGDTAWAAALVRVAEAAPRLLIPGWEVTRADQFSVELGEMTFGNGGRELELRWQPAGGFQGLVDDRERSSDLSLSAPVADTEARVFRYEGTTDFTAVWRQGDYVLELRGVAAGVDAFEAVLASLRQVDVGTWLSAMPRSVVKPAGRAAVVEEMLAGIPLPPGLDVGRLKAGDAVRDRYQLGAAVTGAVACGWIERWLAARATGDAAAARIAVRAMDGSRGWTILREMDENGDYPEVVWQYADAMAAGRPITGGKKLSSEESYRTALGCDAP
ncbi:MAG: hypothetical protein IT201_13620 [Thermoleophilia bacterium]|nr:hypothetical protein [Thermoleophilia bacterium]